MIVITFTAFCTRMSTTATMVVIIVNRSECFQESESERV